MKKILGYIVVILVLAGVQTVLADNTTPLPGASVTPVVKVHHKHKATPTPQVTPSPTPTVGKSLPTPKATSTPTPAPRMSAITSSKIYDRINMPGDLRRALSLAVGTFNADSSKRHTVFLALDRVSTNRDDKERKKAYVRFNIDQMEWVGPRNAWIVLSGTVYEQSGGDCKVGDPIEVAVDFKDIKIDYDGNKLGEIQKGNDLAGAAYEILQSHGAYQLVLEANDQVKDNKYKDDTAAYLVKARDGYAFLDSLNFSREASH
jgi:hypothetical protein